MLTPRGGRLHYFKVYGLADENCATALEDYIDTLPGVYSVDIDYETGLMKARLLKRTYPWEIEDAASDLGYAAVDAGRGDIFGGVTLELALLALTFVATAFSFASLYMKLLTPEYAVVLGAFITFICGYTVMLRAIKAATERKLSIEILTALSAIAVTYYEWYTGEQMFYVAGIIIFIAQATYLFERQMSRRLASAKFLVPAVALAGGEWKKVSDLRPGEIVMVKAGMRSPADGVAETGECKLLPPERPCSPRDIKAGDKVSAGSLVLEGEVSVKSGNPDKGWKVSRLSEAFSDARAHKDIALRYPKAIEKGMLIVALLGSAFVLLFMGSMNGAVALLIVAAPLAFFVARPLAVLMAGAAGGRGVSFASHGSLERIGMADTVVISGLGSLLESAKVAEVYPVSSSPDDVKEAMASSRPEQDQLINAANAEYLKGYTPAGKGGALMRVRDASRVSRTPPELVKKAAAFESKGKAVRLAMRGDAYLGLVAYEIVPRKDLMGIVESLKKSGVSTVALMAAESEQITVAVAKEAGIATTYPKMGCTDRAVQLKKLSEGGANVMSVSMPCDPSGLGAGSGDVIIGDSAKGLMGLEDARVASLSDLPSLVAIAKSALKVSGQGMSFAFYFNTIAIIMASVGIVDIQIGILMAVASVVGVATNSMRVLLSR